MEAQRPFDSRSSQVVVRSIRGRSRFLVAGLALSATFCACYAALPSSVFRTHAVLAIGDGTVALRAAMARVAAESAVSKPVIERAAAALVAADRKAPAPGLAERIGVATGTGNATSQQARLGDSIAPMLRAEPGLVPGTVEITASAASPERAAQLADALADAFVTQQDDAAAKARARYDAKIGARLEAAQAGGLAARRRLIGLGGVSLDPAQARVAAAALTSAAEMRLAGVRSIIASGTPPISDRKDLPPVLAIPQASYLDLKAQLDKESQVLGERNPTIIALQDGVKSAAAKLQAEWKRLQKIAEADVAAAKEHESALRKGDTPADATRRAQVEDARRALQTAEDAVALMQKQTDAMPEDPSFRLIARAPVPNAAVGMGQATRLLLSLLAALGTLAFMRGAGLLMARSGKVDVSVDVAPVDVARVDVATKTNAPQKDKRSAPAPAVRPIAIEAAQTKPAARTEALGAPEAPAMRFFDDEPEPAIWTRRTSAPTASRPMPISARSAPRPGPEPRLEPAPASRHEPSDDDMTDAMRAILADIDGIEPGQGGVPTVMVAANEEAAATMPVTLALARVAAEAELRVLLIETDRARPQLAAAAATDADPVLLDLFGTLRIALPAEDGHGFLTLAPVLRDASRLASDLAMARTTAFIDDLAFAFDLILIDGAVATEAAAAGWTADAFVRVGLSASRRDDERFCATLGSDSTMLMTTILPSDIEPESAQPIRKPVPVSRIARAPAARPAARVASPAPATMPRRSFARR